MTEKLDKWVQFQSVLDRQARDSLLAVPSPERPNLPSYSGKLLTDVLFQGALHRFDIAVDPPSLAQGLKASNRVDALGSPFQFRCTPTTQEFNVQPGVPVPILPWSFSQT